MCDNERKVARLAYCSCGSLNLIISHANTLFHASTLRKGRSSCRAVQMKTMAIQERSRTSTLTIVVS